MSKQTSAMEYLLSCSEHTWLEEEEVAPIYPSRVTVKSNDGDSSTSCLTVKKVDDESGDSLTSCATANKYDAESNNSSISIVRKEDIESYYSILDTSVTDPIANSASVTESSANIDVLRNESLTNDVLRNESLTNDVLMTESLNNTEPITIESLTTYPLITNTSAISNTLIVNNASITNPSAITSIITHLPPAGVAFSEWTNKPLHNCPYCATSYTYQEDLVQHIEQNHNRFNIIGGVVNNVTVLDPPTQGQYTMQKHSCSEGKCSHKFRTPGYSPKYVYHCLECGSEFLHKSVLKVHMRIHRGPKAFRCRFCPKQFDYDTARDQHLRRAHTGGKGVYMKNLKTQNRGAADGAGTGGGVSARGGTNSTSAMSHTIIQAYTLVPVSHINIHGTTGNTGYPNYEPC